MLYWAVVFFVVALVAAIFGFTGIAAGAAEIAVQTSAPVVANFSDGGKTITISAAPQQASSPAPARTETPLPPPSDSAK